VTSVSDGWCGLEEEQREPARAPAPFALKRTELAMKRAIGITGTIALVVGGAAFLMRKPSKLRPGHEDSGTLTVQAQKASELAEHRSAPPARELQPAPLVVATTDAAAVELIQAGEPAPEGDELRRSAAEQAQLVRLPLITAIRGPYATPQARYDAMHEALERSGPTNEAWAGQAGAVFSGWNKSLGDAGGHTDSTSMRCFLAGCEISVTFPDRASYERAASAFRTIPEETSIHGGRVQTPGVATPDGRVQMTWMMLRPDSAPPKSVDPQ